MLSKLFKSKNKSWANKKKNPPTIAAAAIMLKLAQSDGERSQTEMTQLRKVLHGAFKLSDKEIETVIATTEKSQTSIRDLDSLTEEVRQNWGNARRIQLLECLWILAYADDRIDTKETELIERVAKLLCLTQAEQFRAQASAEKQFGLADFD